MENSCTNDDQSKTNVVVGETPTICPHLVTSLSSTDTLNPCFSNNKNESNEITHQITGLNFPHQMELLVNSSTCLSNSLPIDLTFYKKNENNYAVLERHNVTDSLKLIVPVRIPSEGLINKITLQDFPFPGQYTLSINGQNCATATYNGEIKMYEFDLTKSNKMLNIFKELASSQIEPKLDNRSDYLNLYRIDQLRIIVPHNLQLNNKHQISMHGYFRQCGQWSQLSKELILYPYDTYRLFIKHPTESLDIEVDQPGGTIILKLDGYEVHKLIPDKQMIRMKFNDRLPFYCGKENAYLSEEINNNTINASRIGDIFLIALGCKITQIHQNYYQVYDYPSRTKRFI